MTAHPTPADRLMMLTIGYWASQSVYVAAKLGLADQLADAPSTSADLARRNGTDPSATARLLRFLRSLGVVAGDDEGWQLTEVGRLLRSDEHGSMRDLAILYGEEFYAGWGQLLHAVRTGETGFAKVYGTTMYPYFSRSAESTAKFDRAMAAGSEFFAPIAEVHDFSGARTVVDVAGGNGALLATVLHRYPHARGVLFDTAHVLDAARPSLIAEGLGERIEFVAGDYYDKVPHGDTYLLSRVLHGRDDDKCVEVLARIREVIPDDGRLLIVERVIGGEPSLADWFDMQMLTIAGGRERTSAEYDTVLRRAGFAVETRHDLPLDTELIVTVPQTGHDR